MARLRPLRLPLFAALSVAPFASASAHEARTSTPDPDSHAQSVCDLAAPPNVGEHPAPVDCTESKDTGYMSGNPFEITVVHIDGMPVEKLTANAYWVMREAAAADGIDMHLNSGFRTNAEQQELYECYINCSCNDCNQAATPGYSNHQSGHALDINTGGGTYGWLAAHGGDYGFTETVQGEPWHWEWWGGGPGGGVCDISIAPTGYLDAADCETVHGWAQDPDAPDVAIDVHVYFNGPTGDPNAIGVPMTANEERADLCMSLGSCAHGYTMDIPASLRDGAMHPVYVYGIDNNGTNNAQLAQSPAAITCPAPDLPGVRRKVANPDVMKAWSFDAFWQLVTLDEATLLAIPEWEGIEPAPQLLIADDGNPDVWLKDGLVRRHIASVEVAGNWHFDLATAVVTPAAEVNAIPEGTPLWDKPLLVRGPSQAVYQLDDIQCAPGSAAPGCHSETSGGDSSGGPTSDTTPTTGDEPGTGGNSGNDDDTGNASSSTGDSTSAGSNDDDAGCGCRSNTPAPSFALGLLVLGLLRRRRN